MLALWQAEHVKGILERAGQPIELVTIKTRGDQILDKPLHLVGGKALFTKELDVALLNGDIDLAVHSLKDLPTVLPGGLMLGAVSERGNPFDAFVPHPAHPVPLEDLPIGATLATSSLRRTTFLKAWRPDLNMVPVRGNVDTRLEKLAASEWDGLVLACAGLIRLGHATKAAHSFNPAVLLPAVGQGALGVVCRADRPDLVGVLHRHLLHGPSYTAVRAERAFLNTLQGGCQVPVGAYAWHDASGKYILEGGVASLDEGRVIRARINVDVADPEAAGVALASQLLSEGADALLPQDR